ncbi:MAG: S49 family peptidase [Planctomycetota bacterium]
MAEQDSHPTADRHTPPPPPGQAPPYVPAAQNPPREKSGGGILRRVFQSLAVLIILGSFVMNVYLLTLLAMQSGGATTFDAIESGSDEQIVALYTIDGMISAETARNFATFSREIAEDDAVQAVVLRVNTPGGGVGASDVIRNHIQKLQAQGKKVVVSMGSLAASGGYYISAPADEILAEPTTMTGSIGVIMYHLVLQGTLEKLGVEPVVIKSTAAEAWKDELSPARMPSERERQHLRELLDQMQRRFENVVREGRGDRLRTEQLTWQMEVEENGELKTVEHTETAPLNGKVYMAREALDYGLVDSIGYQSDAIEHARKLVGAANPTVRHYRIRQGLLGEILGGPAVEVPDLKKEIRSFGTPRFEMVWRVD